MNYQEMGIKVAYGIATFPGGEEYEVSFYTPDPEVRDVLRKRGLSDEEMDRGVANVKSGEHPDRTMKHVVFDAENRVKVIPVPVGSNWRRRSGDLRHYLTYDETLAIGAAASATMQKEGEEGVLIEKPVAAAFAQVFTRNDGTVRSDVEHQPAEPCSFFSDKMAQETIAGMDAEQTAEVLRQQPEMVTQYLHELWRTKRMEVVYDVAKVEGTIPRETFRDNLIATAHKIGMRERSSTARKYVADTIATLYKADLGVPFAERLSPGKRQLVKVTTDSVMYAVSAREYSRARSRFRL